MFTKQIIECMENENMRAKLKGIPLALISSAEYIPDWIYWMDFNRNNKC